MRLSSGAILLGGVLLVSGCGARTSDDELLGGGAWSSAGGSESGGASTGATGGSGGFQPGGGGSGGFDPGGGGSGGSGGFTGGTGGVGQCCTPTVNAGCEDPFIEECVCFLDEYCCTGSWDETCVLEVGFCGDSCSMGGSGGGPTGGGGAGGSPTGGGGAGGSGGVPTGGGGAGGSGGVPTGGGGAGGSGGAPGGGGAGGSQSCELVFPGECEQCLCESCYGELTACLSDIGCLAVAGCVFNSGCSGLGCLSACSDVIASVGGLGSPAVTAALGYAACAAQTSCDACF